jgi:hypothetical protein
MRRPLTNRIFAYALILTMIGSVFSVVLPAVQPSFASHLPVTVNVAQEDVTHEFEPGDSVTVEGFVDDLVDNEDVTIKFNEPGGTTDETVNFGEPSSNRNFDAVFEIPNNAEGGAWSVEADYNGEQAYSYFLVEYDEAEVDVITLDLDENSGIYEAGAEVTIAGQVDHDDPDEDTVNIKVFDPADPETEIEDEDVELDGNDFEFSFNLDNDAPHGRYAVKVTYDIDEQEGAILFEIEDEDAGGSGGNVFTGDEDTDGDLTAQIEKDTYNPAGNVLIEGTIDSYNSGDNDELAIEVQDPDDVEVSSYGENDVTVQSDGDFEYDFALTGTAEAGTYSVIISYAGDAVTLTFEVTGDSSGGSGGSSDGVSVGDLTAKLNKASYLAGETMTVSGTADEVADESDNEVVSILVYRPNGVVILGASEYLTPSANGAFSANIVLDSDLEAEDDYKVIVSYLGDDVELPFDITGVSSTPSDQIAIDTNQDNYTASSTVVISGQVPASLIVQGQNGFLIVKKPDGNPCRTDQITIASSGSFSYSMPLGGNCGVAGEYDVEITYNGKEGATTFTVTGSSGTGNGTEYNLNVEGRNYPIKYELTDGSIDRIFARSAEDKLIVELLNADQAGQLTLVLPREVIDAVENGEDVAYVVTIENESGNIETVEVEESGNTNTTRTVVIDYPAGASRIEIAGTQVVPEFGSVAAITLIVAIVGIIVVTTRYGGSKFSLFRQ